MAQLLIQNKGEAPAESFTLLGASLSRSEDGLIGQFGSGAKLAITTLLRKGLSVTIYTGATRMEFKTKEITIKDGNQSKVEKQVYIQYGGTSKKKQDLGWVVGFGELDWQSTDMAIREFIANAIDQTVKQGDTVIDAYTDKDLIVELVPDEAKRAQSGYTRVFIEANEECGQYLLELHKRFLHFSSVDLTKQIIPKDEPGKARIYLEGVFVCSLDSCADAICDYNFQKYQIKIDESRNLNEYIVKAAIGNLYKNAEVDELVRVFQILQRGETRLETCIDSFYLKDYSGTNDRQKDKWRKAWEQVNGNGVACGYDQAIVADFVQRKGYNISVVKDSGWLDAMKEYGIPSAGDVLDANEQKGRTTTPPSFEAIDAVKEVWNWIEATGLTNDRECPKVRGFDQLSNADVECFGFYNMGENQVHIRNDIQGDFLYETALEEIAHYTTQATDCSRDFQSFLTRVFVRWMR